MIVGLRIVTLTMAQRGYSTEKRVRVSRSRQFTLSHTLSLPLPNQ